MHVKFMYVVQCVPLRARVARGGQTGLLRHIIGPCPLSMRTQTNSRYLLELPLHNVYICLIVQTVSDMYSLLIGGSKFSLVFF
jgi:hypothetical protein